MKKAASFIFAFACLAVTYSQNINFNWVKRLDAQFDLPKEDNYFIGTDAAKNVYVAGNFHNTMDIDPGTGVFNLTNSSDNIFVCKLDPFGNFLWGKQLGNGNGSAICRSLAVDTGGNIYTTGYFSGQVDFDPGENVYDLNAPVNISPDNHDIFISKLNTDGNFQWVKQTGASHVDEATSIDTDIFGNVYTTGYFTGVADLDPGPGTFIRGSNGVVTAFITKFDAAGDLKFADVLETNQRSFGEFVRTDNKGNVYLTGHYNGTIDFDPGVGVFSQTATFNSQNTFLAKFDPLGNFIWVKQDIIGYDFVVDANENVYLYDDQLSKYDINGNLLWTKLVGGGPYSSFEHADIKSDASRNIYITGMFRYTQDFDPGPSSYNLTSTGAGFASDVFVCMLSADGDLIWVKTFGSTGEDYAAGLAIDNSGNVYTTGVFQGTVDFDPGSGEYDYTSSPRGSIFIHKMSTCVKNDSTLNITTCKNFTLNDITYKNSGTYTQVIANVAGCDSIITLNLQIQNLTADLSVVACKGYEWHDRLLTASGLYSDTLTSINGCDSIVNLHLVITDKITTMVDASICKGQVFLGHTLAGTYTDTFHTTTGCDSLVTIHLAVLDKPAPDLGLIKEICPGDSIILQPAAYQSYRWQDGSAQPYYVVKKPGLYSVTANNDCGEGYNEIMVYEKNCKIYFPGAFTPNRDGKNERFIILNPHNIRDYHLSVYNRLGQKVFETKDVSYGWDGMYKGQIAEQGAYVWFCEFNEGGILKSAKGPVILLK